MIASEAKCEFFGSVGRTARPRLDSVWEDAVVSTIFFFFVMPESSILPPHNYSHNIHIQNVTQWFLSHYRSREIIRILPPPHLLRVQLNALLCRDYCSLPAEVAATGSLLISKSILLRRGMCMIPACCHTLFSPIYFCCGLENMGS